MNDEQSKEKEKLIAKHPNKKQDIEKLLFSCAKLNNQNVWQNFFCELEIALDENDPHKVILLTNMLRRMHIIEEENKIPITTMQPKRRLKILIISFTCFLFL